MRMKIKKIPYWHKVFSHELERDVDVSLIITGPKGFGKSTLTIWMMMWTIAYFNNGMVEVEPVLQSLTWSAEEWVDKMRLEYRYQAIGFEEFGNAMTVEEVNNLINEMIRKVQSSNRFLNILKIFNVPGFVHVPPKVRNTLNYWINVTKQGQGILYRVVPEEGPDQRPMMFYKERLGWISYIALPDKIYSKYKEIKMETELKRYQEAKAKMDDAKFKSLPVTEKRKIIARKVLELKTKGINLIEHTKDGKERFKWGFISNELGKFGISVSTATLKRLFSDIFKERGWEGIEEMANM